jgi:hypothetical protein
MLMSIYYLYLILFVFVGLVNYFFKSHLLFERRSTASTKYISIIFIAFLLCSNKNVFAQDSSKLDKMISFPDKLFASLDKKTRKIEDLLDKQTARYLNRIQRQENKLKKKLWKKDSTLAKQMFEGIDDKYKKLKDVTGKVNKYRSNYIGHLDSLSTALDFLKNQSVNNAQLQKALEQYKSLQLKFNAYSQINEFITQRREMLKQQFQSIAMIKEVNKFRKEVFYYQEQVKTYKEMFCDPSKVEEKLLSIITVITPFKDFFAKNSLFGSLFALPGNTMNPAGSITGLQSRQMVTQSLISRFGSNNLITQQLQQNVQNAQGQINAIKNKLLSYTSGSYGNSDPDIPNFTPNQQRTKSFLKRLEYGGDIQSQKAKYFFPVTSDIALSLGYRLNDKSSIGIGASYKMGWGNSWNNLKITSQGFGLRTYLDWKIKKSYFINGGYEQNYRSIFYSINQLKNYSAWQTSGLIGVFKKYSISKKMNGEIKLLWDFLSYQQIPRTQPIVFRVGYSLK